MENMSFDQNLMYKKHNYALQLLGNMVFVILVILSIFFMAFSITYTDTPVIGVSMQPTLNAKGETKSDIVYINRFSTYTRKDIIVINQPDNAEVEYIIKRLIGVEGDTINITLSEITGEPELYVNGVLQVEPYIFDTESTTDETNNGMYTTYQNFQTLKITHPTLFTDGVLVVPQGQVFVLGDNRGKSSDSSINGTYLCADVVGRVDFIVPYGTDPLIYFLNIFTPFTFAQN